MEGAQPNLGVAYAKGEGVARNEAEAAKWYRFAGEQGDTGGQFSLAGLYFF